MRRIVTLGVCTLATVLLAGCGNSNSKNNAESSSSSSSSKVVKHNSSKKETKAASSSSSVDSQKESSSSSSESNDGSNVHLTGGQSTIDYLNKVKGDQGWTVDGGTYGGAHGAPTDGNYIPYNTVRNSNGDVYYVYANGKIVPQSDIDSNGDQVNYPGVGHN